MHFLTQNYCKFMKALMKGPPSGAWEVMKALMKGVKITPLFCGQNPLKKMKLAPRAVFKAWKSLCKGNQSWPRFESFVRHFDLWKDFYFFWGGKDFKLVLSAQHSPNRRVLLVNQATIEHVWINRRTVTTAQIFSTRPNSLWRYTRGLANKLACSHKRGNFESQSFQNSTASWFFGGSKNQTSIPVSGRTSFWTRDDNQ
jgi:hypothetical protein